VDKPGGVKSPGEEKGRINPVFQGWWGREKPKVKELSSALIDGSKHCTTGTKKKKGWSFKKEGYPEGTNSLTFLGFDRGEGKILGHPPRRFLGQG